MNIDRFLDFLYYQIMKRKKTKVNFKREAYLKIKYPIKTQPLTSSGRLDKR